MKGIWKPLCNVVDGERKYIAFRLLDTTEAFHGGNFECMGEYTTDRESVVKFCEILNAENMEGDND